MEVGAFQGGLCYYCLTRSNLCESPRQSRGFTCDNYYNNQIAYLGPRYIGLALRRCYADRIDEAQLADHLNVAPRNIVPLEEKFLGRGE